MRLSWGSKSKKSKLQLATGQYRPASKLDHEIIGVSKFGDKNAWRRLTSKKLLILYLVALAFIIAGTWGYVTFFDSEPEPTPVEEDNDPFHGQKPDWAPIFEYKPEDSPHYKK